MSQSACFTSKPFGSKVAAPRCSLEYDNKGEGSSVCLWSLDMQLLITISQSTAPSPSHHQTLISTFRIGWRDLLLLGLDDRLRQFLSSGDTQSPCR